MELSYESFYLLERKELNAWGGESLAQQKGREKGDCYNSFGQGKIKNIIIFPGKCRKIFQISVTVWGLVFIMFCFSVHV